MVSRTPSEEAVWLEKVPSREEIKSTVWGCDLTKAPGVNGFNLNFIRKLWDVIGNELCTTVEGFFEFGMIPRGANMTWVTHISKIEGAKKIHEFRPIRMVGSTSVYKVISKILANKLRNVVPNLVGECQSAFVSGRQIWDSALITCEVVHWLRKKRKPKCTIKLDFHKAYDRVKWNFVDLVLQRMGFSDK